MMMMGRKNIVAVRLAARNAVEAGAQKYTRQTCAINTTFSSVHSPCVFGSLLIYVWWLGGVMTRTLDLRFTRCGTWVRLSIASLSPWMGDCLRTGKPSRYINNTKVNSAFHPSGVGKSSTGLSGRG